MEPRVSLITLGVDDLDRAVAFYEQVVGWKKVNSEPGIAFFDLGGLVFSLYPHVEMLKEWDPSEESARDYSAASYRGFALAHNVSSRDAVDEIFARLKGRDATILKEPEEVFWGGYSGYFVDPDGNRWEVAHNPYWTVQPDGRISMSAS